MQNRATARSLAAGALLALATLGTSLHADSVIEIDDALAAQIRQEIQRLPPVSGHSLDGIAVEARRGALRLSGIIEDLEARRAVNDVLENVDGLHMNQIDDHLVQQ